MREHEGLRTKHIFVTGGVVSSLGKGITAASIALLLGRRGYRVRMQKLDPYLNVDPGTMSPYQHGEVYVTDDKAETDLDLGHYERFTGLPCQKESNYTTGRIYQDVIRRERAGDYLGQTVQVIPHITDAIKVAIRSIAAPDVDIVITEIGGTVGDIESLPYLEAIRQFRHDIGKTNTLFIHVTLVPYLKAAGELKTKPSQQSAGILREIGIIPDILVCRCEQPLTKDLREKLALFCNVERKLVFEERDVAHSIYEVPLEMAAQDLDTYVLELLGMHVRSLDLTEWRRMVETQIHPQNGTVDIAVVGKYMKHQDAYKSIYEALSHGGIAHSVTVKVHRVESEDIEKYGLHLLDGMNGVLVPGGFGARGIEGKILAIKQAREQAVPFFGICLGLQCAVIEYARHVCELANANSTEFHAQTPHPVVVLLEALKGVADYGGTMRLGAFPCQLQPGTKTAAAYASASGLISERHRHRYEVNNEYREALTARGMVLSGLSPNGQLVELLELPDHPWFVGCQFHPEFKSTPLHAHPLFSAFVGAAVRHRDGLFGPVSGPPPHGEGAMTATALSATGRFRDPTQR